MGRSRIVLRALVLLAFGLVTNLSAHGQTAWTFDGGGSVSSEVGPLPGWNTGRVYLVDRLDGNLNLRQKLEALTLDYNLSGFFRFTSEREITGDLSELSAKLNLRGFPGSRGLFRVSLGRIPLTEPSGLVLRQPGDGLSIGASVPAFKAELTAAYLGFLLKNTNNVLLSASDVTALNDPNVVLAPSRAVGLLALTFPELVLRTDLGLWGMYLLGMGGSLPAGRWYAGLSEQGPIWGPLSQRSDLVTGAELAAQLSLLARIVLRAEFPRVATSRAELELLYASGDTPSLSAFMPLTGDTAGVILATPLQNLFRLSLGYSAHPFTNKGFEWLQAIAPFISSRWYFRQSATPAAAVTYDPPGNYYGTELESGLAFRHGTDPEISVSGGFFADAAAAFHWFARASVVLNL